ncbi:MAG TPA: Ig-like domain-containing protein [Longimicrobium sp.]|nr:Ig-like domain-containing protein [Longimicrobium sp.]
MKLLHRCAVLVLAAAVAGCAGEPTSSTRTPVAPRKGATVSVQVSCPGVVWVGNYGYCSATGRDQYGAVTSTFATSWNSSNPPSISSFGGGQIYAYAPGGAWIGAWVDGVYGSTFVNVAYTAVLTSVAVTPSSANVYKGGTTQLTAKAYDQYGYQMSASFTWGTSNSSVATVSSTGLVSGVNLGSATITASSLGKSGSSSITVVNPPLSASLSGPQYVSLHTSSQYTASASGGTGPYTYEWRSRQGSASFWGSWSGWFSTGSSNYTFASINSCGLDRDQLEVRVTDSLGATANSTFTFYITNPC